MTKVDQSQSDPLAVTCGVHQGSISGPYLFTMYSNDLPFNVNHKPNLHADDTTRTLPGPSVDNVIVQINELLGVTKNEFRVSLKTIAISLIELILLNI